MSFRVLHIEDDLTQILVVQKLLERSLGDEDYMYSAVRSLEDAKYKLSEGCFDIALVDLHLPDSYGTQSVDAVKALCPNIPIVVLTSDDDLHTAKETIAAGADSYVLKTEQKTLPLVLLLTAEKYRLRQELQSKCDLYNSVVDLSPDYIVRFRPDGTITFANKAICALLNMSLGNVLGTNLSDYMRGKFMSMHNDKVEALTLENPTSESVETKLSNRWVLWKKVGIFDRQGRLLEVQTIGRDVTYRHQQAEELLQLAQVEVARMKDALFKATEKTHQILKENEVKIQNLERGQ